MNNLYLSYISNTEKGEDGSIIIPASSIGSNKVLSELALYTTKPNPPVYDIYLINLHTVIRNNMNETDSLQKVSEDLNTIKTYISEYINIVPHQSPIVLFYLPTYKIPTVYARKLSPSTTKVEELAEAMGKFLAKEVTDVSVNNVSMFFLRLKAAPSMGGQLISHVRHLSKKGTASKVLLWSHLAVDYHIAKIFYNTSIIESYTGRILYPKEFGEKVFKSKFIPFNNYTHITFGDSTYVQPVLQRAKRAQAFEIAEKRRWDLKTDIEILSELTGLNIPKPHLTILKF